MTCSSNRPIGTPHLCSILNSSKPPTPSYYFSQRIAGPPIRPSQNQPHTKQTTPVLSHLRDIHGIQIRPPHPPPTLPNHCKPNHGLYRHITIANPVAEVSMRLLLKVWSSLWLRRSISGTGCKRCKDIQWFNTVIAPAYWQQPYGVCSALYCRTTWIAS